MSRYLIFWKPFDVLCQFTPAAAGGQTLKDFIPVPDVYPVGRLDRDSEGLLLLSDDGPLRHRLTDPRFRHPRTHWVQVEGVPGAAALDSLRGGVVVRDYRTKPAKAQLPERDPIAAPRSPPIRFRKSIPTSWLELTLTEGRNRQVRRMAAAIGYPALRLVRAAIGGLTLDGLRPGEWRELTGEEVRALRRW